MTRHAANHPTADPAFDPRAFLRHLFDAAVLQADPLHALSGVLPPPPRGRTVIVGAGKAAGAMAQAVEALWPAGAPLSGLVVTRYGHVPPRKAGLPSRIEVVEASHPVPDAAGLAAARRMLETVQGLGPDDLVICLISGGGSALLSLPIDGIGFAEKQSINQQLLLSGAHIGEMNCVRKHLSAIKGGRLAAACAPAEVLTLAISDVPGDELSIIASGPTVPDPSTAAQALEVLDRYRIGIPPALRERLASGLAETPKPGDEAFSRSRAVLIATPRQSLEAAARAALACGVTPHLLSDEMEGESREVGKVHAALARSVAAHGQPFARPCVLLSGGETTVTVRPRQPGAAKGRGGRAGEFCLGLAQALGGNPAVWAIAADTDGIDGVEDNAGAFVTPQTAQLAAAAGLSLADHLDRNDAYGFFERLGDLVTTGPTYTNVNDFRAILIT